MHLFSPSRIWNLDIYFLQWIIVIRDIFKNFKRDISNNYRRLLDVEMKIILFLVAISQIFGFIQSESEVVFFEDEGLSTQDETELDAATLAMVQDNKNTGSYLFKFENELEKASRISLNIRIEDLMTDSTPYVRMSPSFITCLQKVFTHCRNRNELQLQLDSGYKTNTDIGSSTSVQDLYAASGTGAVLSIVDGGDIIKIVDAAAMFCPTIFAEERAYLGLVVMSSSVHIHMTGAAETGPHFSVDGYSGMTTAEFETYATDKVNTALDPVGSLGCSQYSTLASGEVYPTGTANPEDVLGSADSDVNDESDYLNRLVVYPGGDVEPTGQKMMAPRMFEVVRKLQLLVREKLADTLKIQKLFATEAGSLHLEGRLGEFQLVNDNSAANIESLTNLALCSGAFYVKNNGDHILVGVKKQSRIDAKKISFQQGELLQVDIVSAMEEQLQLPDYLEFQQNSYPVFDGEFQKNKSVSELSQLWQYMSPSTRYLRLHPAIVQCYDNILRHEKKWNDGIKVPIDIKHAFLTNDDLLSEAGIIPDSDPRKESHTLGLALHINYGSGFTKSDFANTVGIEYDYRRLVKTAIHVCAPEFDAIDTRERYSMGVGIYEDGVYIDIRDEFQLWFDDLEMMSDDTTFGDYYESMEERWENAIDGRIVNPEDPKKAYESDIPPQKQSIHYVHKHPSHIQERRKRRQAGDADEESCVVQTDTDFCQVSRTHRNNEVAHIWENMQRKHLVSESFESQLKVELEGCFGVCGTCLIGEVYEDKTEHCSNFLHRIPFVTNNEDANSTNIYSLTNFHVRNEACKGERHCLDESPLYAILASSTFALFRPDPKKSIEQELFGAQDNPLPVVEITYGIYAISAKGEVHAWVTNEVELGYIRGPLRVAMLYNKEVTNVVIHVVNEDSYDAVESALENMISDWVRSGNSVFSREIIAPYSMELVPQNTIVKRDTRQAEGFTLGEQLLLERRHYEYHWAQKLRH